MEQLKSEIVATVLFNNKKAAEFLGLAPETLIRWRWANQGPRYLKIGKNVRYRFDDLQAWLDGRVVGTKDQAVDQRSAV